MKTKIEPCPFCGNNEEKDFEFKTISARCGKIRNRSHIIHCWKCGTEGPVGNTEKKTIEAWNKRVTLENKQEGERA